MSTHSNGGKTWSTKLARISELSRNNKTLVFNKIGHLIDFELLLDCFQSLDGKKALGIDGISKEIYEGDLTANISELLIRIRRGTYRPQMVSIAE